MSHPTPLLRMKDFGKHPTHARATDGTEVRIVGPWPSQRVIDALAAARAMTIRSVWCGGLWWFDLAAYAWRRAER